MYHVRAASIRLQWIKRKKAPGGITGIVYQILIFLCVLSPYFHINNHFLTPQVNSYHLPWAYNVNARCTYWQEFGVQPPSLTFFFSTSSQPIIAITDKFVNVKKCTDPDPSYGNWGGTPLKINIWWTIPLQLRKILRYRKGHFFSMSRSLPRPEIANIYYSA